MEQKLIEELQYQDEKADSRTDALLNTLDKILFWVRIIGIYFFIMLLATILVVITKGAIISKLISLLLQ